MWQIHGGYYLEWDMDDKKHSIITAAIHFRKLLAFGIAIYETDLSMIRSHANKTTTVTEIGKESQDKPE